MGCVSGNCRCQKDVCQVSYFETDLYPDDIEVSPDGDLVTTTDDHQVVVFSEAGAVRRTIGEFGTDPGEFRYPSGVAVDGDGVVYVADEDNQRIQKILESGDAEVWPVDGYPQSIAVNATGAIYTSFDGQIHRLTQAGEVAYSWGPGGQADAFFDYPYGIATAPGGVVYVVDEGADLVYRFTDIGPDDVTEDWATGGSGVDPGEFQGPWGVAVQGDRVFVSDNDNRRAQAFNAADGSFLFEWQLRYSNGYLEYPYGIAVGPNGRIYVVGSGAVYTFELGSA